MRQPAVPLVLLGMLLLGCGSEPGNPAAAGGAAGSDETGGDGGSGGNAAGGKGGNAGRGGIAGSGGASAPDAAATAGTGGGASGADAGTPDAGSNASDTGTAAPDPGTGPIPGCPGCKSIFDGKTLDGWQQDPAGSFEVKDGAIASTGKGAHAWTREDYGDFRLFFSVRQIRGDHKPCTTLFTTRPATGRATRGLSGIQFQPPMGGSWDYRPGKNSGPDKVHWTYPNPRPQFVVTKWHRCEILARASTGEFKAACCEIEGKTSCQGQEVLRYKDPTAGKKGPFALMMHNPGLFDEFKDFYVDTAPVGDELLSTKYAP